MSLLREKNARLKRIAAEKILGRHAFFALRLDFSDHQPIFPTGYEQPSFVAVENRARRRVGVFIDHFRVKKPQPFIVMKTEG